MEIVNYDTCRNCQKENAELVVFKSEGWLWTTDILICQTCISKAFRSFSKDN